MVRDLFRGLIRIALILCIMVSCGETFYFMGELSKNAATDRYNPYYNSSNGYYGRSSTRVTDVEEIEDVSEVDSLPSDNNESSNGYYY